MASINLLASGRYRVQLRKKAIGYKEAYFDTREEAESWAQSTEDDLLQRHHSAGPVVSRELTFNQLIDRYFDSPVFSDKAVSTQDRERSASVRLREFFGREAVAVIDYARVQEYFDLRSRERRRLSNGKTSDKKISGHTIRLEKAFLTAIYKFGKKRKLVPRNIMRDDDWDLPTCHDREGRITLEQQMRLVQAAEVAIQHSRANRSLRPWVLLVFETGTRPGEAAKIELDWIDLGQRRILVPRVGQKKRNPRVILLTEEMSQMVAEEVARAKAAGSRYLFWSRAAEPRLKNTVGQPVRRRRTAEESAQRECKPFAYYHAWKRICAAAGLPDTINPHIVRHEFISRLFENTTLNDSQIASLVGDVNVLSLAPYKHLRVGHLRGQQDAHLAELGDALAKLREQQRSNVLAEIGELSDGEEDQLSSDAKLLLAMQQAMHQENKGAAKMLIRPWRSSKPSSELQGLCDCLPEGNQLAGEKPAEPTEDH